VLLVDRDTVITETWLESVLPPPPHPDIRIIARKVVHLLSRNIIKYYFLHL
jgi:hypothetical protein